RARTIAGRPGGNAGERPHRRARRSGHRRRQLWNSNRGRGEQSVPGTPRRSRRRHWTARSTRRRTVMGGTDVTTMYVVIGAGVLVLGAVIWTHVQQQAAIDRLDD